MRIEPESVINQWREDLPGMTWEPGADFNDKLSELSRIGRVVIVAQSSQTWCVLLTPPGDLQYSVSGGGRSPWAAVRDLVNNAKKKWGGG